MKRIIICTLTIVILYSCSSGSEENPVDTKSEGKTTNYERSALLKHVADAIIIPSYTDFQSKMEGLKIAISTFTTTPNGSNLKQLRENWLIAYKAWQHVELYNIGKAEELLYHYYMNVYPANTTEITTALTSGTYDLSSISLQDAQGFPAIDYLINGLGTDTQTIAKYTTDSKSTNRKAYLKAIGERMVTLTNTVVDDWKNGYRDTFVDNTASTATGSISKLVNDVIYYYEKGFRANKIGIPAGVFSGGTTNPKYVEGYYANNISKELALEAFITIVHFYNGKSFTSQTEGESFKTYLKALKRDDINTKITEKLNNAQTAINVLNSSFSDQIDTDNTKMTKAYDAIQKVVPLLKVDMAQAFSIQIDYVDADGD